MAETAHNTRNTVDSMDCGKNARPRSSFAAFSWAALLLPIGYLWFRLINNLRLEWSTNPQYGFGWVVPFLCAGLLMRRWSGNEKAEMLKTEMLKAATLTFALLAVLYLPTRLIEEATPEWRPIQWLLGIEAIGLTLCAVYVAKGGSWLRRLAFPVAFFFVAIPWPTLIEAPLIQGLARLNSGIVVEVLGILGVPAMQHGSVIEVSTGVVGIDDACSGIRSLQSSLMISLFFGEFYRMKWFRRVLLVPASFVLAIAFNVCRTSLLTMIAARKGVDAIARYHDEAGLSILLACTAAMWGLAWVVGRAERRKLKAEIENTDMLKTETPKAVRKRDEGQGPSSRFQRFGVSALPFLAYGLLAWLIVVEAGTQVWYQIRESRLKPGPSWSVAFPRENATFRVLPITATTRELLRFDEGRQGAWSEPDGTEWQAFYFSWYPGRVAGYLAKRHTPEICLPAAGNIMRSGPVLTMLRIHGVELPMRGYVFETPRGLIRVYQCRWEAGAAREAYIAQESARFNLVRGIWAGRGNKGQKVLEIIMSGYDEPDASKRALERELGKLIVVGPAQKA